MCNCLVETSVSSIRALDHCLAQFSPFVAASINTVWLVKLKRFLIESNLFKSLVIEMKDFCEIEVEAEQLRDAIHDTPYKLKELKLRDISDTNCSEEFLLGFLDGVFWSCHPVVLAITTGFHIFVAKSILNILKCKVECWRHPLQSVEVEGIDGSNLLSESEIEFRFRLSWV